MLTRPKTAFWGIFDYIVTLTLNLLTPKFEGFNLAPTSVWSRLISSTNTEDFLLTMFVQDSRTHKHSEKHNVSGHYVFGWPRVKFCLFPLKVVLTTLTLSREV